MHGTLRHRDIATVQTCIDCPAHITPKRKRCDPCRDKREKALAKMHLQKFWKTPKGRALRQHHAKLHRKRRPDLHRANSRRYYARLRPEGKLSTGKSGTVRYLAKHIAHVRAWRAWRKLQPKQVRKVKAPIIRRERAPLLSYPFVSVPRECNAALLAVNAIVPPGIPGREDVCQNILLAILEGRTTFAEIQTNRAALSAFCRAHHRESFELGGYAVSLNEPRRDGRSWHDVLPDTATPWGA